MLSGAPSATSPHAASPSLRAHYHSRQLKPKPQNPSPRSFKRPAQTSPSLNAFATQTQKDSSLQAPQQPSTSNSPAKSTTADAGTQYTPPDWPPTSSRSSLRRTNPDPAPHVADDAPSSPTESPHKRDLSKVASPDPPIPSEPRLRQTPQTQLNDGVPASRRSRSSASASSSPEPSSSAEQRSPTKRHRAADGDVKIMPREYARCNERELAVMISELIMDLIRVNDDIPLEDGQLTRFHSR